MLKPLKDLVVLAREKSLTQTPSGITIPTSCQEKHLKGEVLAIGKQVEEVKVGDTVIFNKYAGTEVEASELTLDGRDVLIMREEDLLGVL